MTVVAGYTWNGSANDGEWTTKSNWTPPPGHPSSTPKNGKAVTIDSDTVDMGGTTDIVRGLTLGLGANLLVGRFDVAALTIVGGSITGNSGIQSRSQGDITLKGKITGDGTGEIDVNSGATSSPNFTLGGGSLSGVKIDVSADTGVTVADNKKERLSQVIMGDMELALTIGNNSTLTLAASTVFSEGFAGPIDLTSNSSLVVAQGSDISSALIGGLGNGGNSIDLRNVAFANLKSESLTQFGSEAVLMLDWGKQSVSLDLIGQYAANFTTHPGPGYEGFVLSSDNTGAHPGTIITYVNNTTAV